MKPTHKAKTTIAAVVITKNEEQNISACLRSIDWCNELIVIDDESTDATPQIANKFGAKVFTRPSQGNFASQRNFALKKATSEWVLFVDADERVSKKLHQEILKVMKRTSSIVGFKLKRQDIFLGKKLRFGETARIEFLRLARKNAGVYKRPVHEVWEVSGKIGRLRHKIIHYPHPTISDFFSQINYYTEIESKYRQSLGLSSNILELISYPLAKFVKNYIILLGFLDGFPGFIMAFMMSFHSLCVRVKIMQRQ